MKIFLSFFALAISSAANSQDFSDAYKAGDQLYVCSREGINLRAQPDANATRVTLLPYSSIVFIQPDTSARVPFVSTGVPGNWVKVKSEGKEGFVFDGFISRIKPIVIPKTKGLSRLEPPQILEYLRATFKVQSKSTEKPKNFENASVYEQYVYENSTETSYWVDEGRSMFTIKLPMESVTRQEAYLMARMLFSEYFTNDACPYNDKMDCFLGSDMKNRISITSMPAYKRHYIQREHKD